MATVARPFRQLCPEADARDAMTDDQFWDHVFPQDDSDCNDDEPPSVDELSLEVAPCPVCGAPGACAYDTEGRPLIHTDTDLPEDEVPE